MPLIRNKRPRRGDILGHKEGNRDTALSNTASARRRVMISEKGNREHCDYMGTPLRLHDGHRRNHHIIAYPQTIAAHPRITSIHRRICLDLSEEFIVGSPIEEAKH